MKRSRYIVAVTLVAVTLCAQRGVQASTPNTRPVTISNVARRLAEKFTLNIRQVVIATHIQPLRRQEMELVASVVPQQQTTRSIVHARGTVFQFRLPPPLV